MNSKGGLQPLNMNLSPLLREFMIKTSLEKKYNDFTFIKVYILDTRSVGI